MEPLIPRRQDLVKVDWKISRELKGLISEYSKYTNYPEEEIIEKFISEINKDSAFLEWVKSKRFTKRAKRYISHEIAPEPQINLNDGKMATKRISTRKKKSSSSADKDVPGNFLLEEDEDYIDSES
ncbi:MAG: hypothetical protein PHC86_05360 [Eubacteriales bacterium]|nr:hypothetical protein [Eubacteriales bacterium]